MIVWKTGSDLEKHLPATGLTILKKESVSFVNGGACFYLNIELPLYIMVTLKGLGEQGFDNCFRGSTLADLDGIKMPFVHINELIIKKSKSP
jgi:hypothetical protein